MVRLHLLRQSFPGETGVQTEPITVEDIGGVAAFGIAKAESFYHRCKGFHIARTCLDNLSFRLCWLEPERPWQLGPHESWCWRTPSTPPASSQNHTLLCPACRWSLMTRTWLLSWRVSVGVIIASRPAELVVAVLQSPIQDWSRRSAWSLFGQLPKTGSSL